MAKDPAFLFYPDLFLTGTTFMSNEDIGLYIKLLCYQHQHGGLINKESFNSLVQDKTLLRSKFIETDVGFYNEKLTIEMEKRNKKSNNMSQTAKKVWEERKNIQLHSKINANVKDIDTFVNNNDTFVIQPKDRNRDISIILKGSDLFKKLTDSENWMDMTCKAFALPWSKEKNYQYIVSGLRMFIAQLEATEGINKSETEIKRHFINWFRIQIDKDPELIRVKNIKK